MAESGGRENDAENDKSNNDSGIPKQVILPQDETAIGFSPHDDDDVGYGPNVNCSSPTAPNTIVVQSNAIIMVRLVSLVTMSRQTTEDNVWSGRLWHTFFLIHCLMTIKFRPNAIAFSCTISIVVEV